MTPAQEQIMFNKIACITLNRTNSVNGTFPFEQVINNESGKLSRQRENETSHPSYGLRIREL